MKRYFSAIVASTLSYIASCWGILQFLDWLFNRNNIQARTLDSVFWAMIIAYPFVLAVVLVFVKFGLYERIKGVLSSKEPDSNPNLKSAVKSVVNLPHYHNKYIHQADYLVHILSSIKKSRVITIAGLGGTGKTRTAVELASRCKKYFNDGIFFFCLEDALTFQDIAGIMAAVFSRGVEAKKTDTYSFAKQFRDVNSLFIFDNCEQVIDSVKSLSQALVSVCPMLKILITSRVPLGLDEEVVFTAMPLTTKRRGYSYGCRLIFDAVGLRITRCSKEQIDSAEKICHLLDGNPMALLLAASKAKYVGLTNVLNALENNETEWIVDHAISGRDKSVFQCIAWSYNLLSDEQIAVLQAISVFSNYVTIDALCYVLKNHMNEHVIHSSIENLCESYFVILDNTAPVTYRMPELIREYLSTIAYPESTTYARRHAEWYSALASSLESRLYGTGSRDVLSRLDNESANIMKAIVYSINTGNKGMLIQLLRLYWYWFLKGRWNEISSILGSFDEGGECLSSDDLALCLLSKGAVEWANSNLDDADEMLSKSVTLFEESGNLWGKGQALHLLGHVKHQQGLLTEAVQVFNGSYDILKSYNGDYWKMLLKNDLADVNIDSGNLDEAKGILQLVASTYDAKEDYHAYGNTLMHIGVLDRLSGKSNSAKNNLRRAISAFRNSGYLRGIASAHKHLADVYLQQNRVLKACKTVMIALSIQERISHKIGTVRSLETVAKLAARTHDYSFSAFVFGKAKKIREDNCFGLNGYQLEESRKLYYVLANKLDNNLLKESIKRGADASYEQVISSTNNWLYVRSSAFRTLLNHVHSKKK